MVQWVLSWEMENATLVEILDESILISVNGHTIGKGMHKTILPPAIDKK